MIDRRELNPSSQSRLLADGFDPASTRCSRTSGSSGHPVAVFFSEKDLAYLRASYLADLFAAGARPTDRIAYCRQGAFARHPLERLGLLRGYHIKGSDPIDAQVDAFLAARPTFVVGFPNVILTIVEELERRGIRYRGVRHVLFGGERVSDDARSAILDHFDAMGHEVYASVEAFTMARSCPAGSLHVRQADVILEVEHDDGSISIEDGEGELLVTRLRGEAMPILRYRQGDRVRIESVPCPCGRRGPVVTSVVGRTEDRIIDPSGRTVHGDFINKVVERFAGVQRQQVIQRAPGAVEVRVEPTSTTSDDLAGRVAAAVRTVADGYDVSVVVGSIEPGPNGKIQMVRVLDPEH